MLLIWFMICSLVLKYNAKPMLCHSHNVNFACSFLLTKFQHLATVFVYSRQERSCCFRIVLLFRLLCDAYFKQRKINKLVKSLRILYINFIASENIFFSDTNIKMADILS